MCYIRVLNSTMAIVIIVIIIVVIIVITLIIMFIIIVECSIIRRRCSSSLAKQRLHRWRQCGGALLTVIAALIHIVRTLRGSTT